MVERLYRIGKMNERDMRVPGSGTRTFDQKQYYGDRSPSGVALDVPLTTPMPHGER